MSIESKALEPRNTPSLPRSNPITVGFLAEPLKYVVKAVRATAKTPEARSAGFEAGDLSCTLGFKTAVEMYVHPNHTHTSTG